MGDIAYDCIGENYNRNRVADRRVLQTIIDLMSLPAGKLIVDIGAGTGNYAHALADSGYRICAVEPSETMRRQAASKDNVVWINGMAEALPLRSASVNAAIIILAIHHFASPSDAADEVARVCPSGPVIILTMDPRQGKKFWFYDYFPEISRHVLKNFPPLEEVTGLFSRAGYRHCRAAKFPLPHDFKDKNMCTGWNRPEIYLDPRMRQNTSGFALASPSAVQEGIRQLENDLKSGRWDALNGHLRKQQSFDAGFMFLSFRA
jgi:ubiquinone/menaquinone biosynthesis C-methylase UbiE